jgi:hypothetical protein
MGRKFSIVFFGVLKVNDDNAESVSISYNTDPWIRTKCHGSADPYQMSRIRNIGLFYIALKLKRKNTCRGCLLTE